MTERKNAFSVEEFTELHAKLSNTTLGAKSTSPIYFLLGYIMANGDRTVFNAFNSLIDRHIELHRSSEYFKERVNPKKQEVDSEKCKSDATN